MALLEVENLKTHFRPRGITASRRRLVPYRRGETLAIVGVDESGCGKSVTAM